MTLNGDISGNGAYYTTNINFTWADNSIPDYSFSYGTYITSSLIILDVLIPTVFALGNNYPNPFNPSTTIQYSVPTFTNVSIEIFDIRGRFVESLVNRNINPGYFSVVWDGSLYSSGLYFVQMIAGEYVNTKKLMLLK